MNIKRILVPLDLHQEAQTDILIQHAAELATRYEAEPVFLNVVDVDFDSSMLDRYDDIQCKFAKDAQKRLKKEIAENAPSYTDAKALVTSGRSYSRVVEVADELSCDLIILAAHKPSMKDYLLGMTAARVVRHANCSVWVVRTD